MTLFWPDDPLNIPANQPQLHALIIGVADYPHLVGGQGHPAVANFGLGQLTTTKKTAERMANWFMSDAKPPIAVGSVELLMSGRSVVRTDGKEVSVEEPTMKGIKDAFKAWWDRCNGHRDNIAVFYFAGHGLSTASQYLLAADFGDPTVPNIWEHCVDFNSMKVGMGANVAQTQIFFIDACREKPIDALVMQNPHGQALASASAFQIARSSSAYFAAADGHLAYGPPDEISYFARALLDSLEGAGAHNQGGRWVVNTFSLGNAIGQIMSQIAAAEEQPLSCTPQPSGLSQMIHQPNGAVVMASIDCQEDMAIALDRQSVKLESPAAERRPWRGKVPPGDWHIVISTAAATILDRSDTLMPPTYDLVIQP